MAPRPQTPGAAQWRNSPGGTASRPGSITGISHRHTESTTAGDPVADNGKTPASPCRSRTGGGLPQGRPPAASPLCGAGSPVPAPPWSGDSNCHWRSCPSLMPAAPYRRHNISRCTAGHSAWCTAHNHKPQARWGTLHGVPGRSRPGIPTYVPYPRHTVFHTGSGPP